MALFKYSAEGKDGKVIVGSIDALNKNFAIEILADKKLKILEIKPVQGDLSSFFAKFKPPDVYALVLMTRRMATMVRAGLPIAQTLRVLAEQETDYHLKIALQKTLQDIRSGASLSWSMNKHPEIFSNIYISMIKVGEATGDMPMMLDRLAEFLERDYNVRKQAKSAMTYPMFIFIFSIIVIIVIFVFVLPNLLSVFSGMNVNLPAPTRVMITLVNTVKNTYVQFGVVLGFIYYSIYARDYLRTPEGKYKWDRLKLVFPAISNLNRKILLANFTRALGTLLSSGIPLFKALEVLMDFMDNEYFKQIVVQPLHDGIREGRSMSQILSEVGFFPPMAIQMIAVGESTGDMPLMLQKISQFYDTEIVYALETFLTLIEPLTIGMMGILVCFILLAVFMPLYDVIMNVG